VGRNGLFSVIIGKDGGGSDSKWGVIKGGLGGLTDSIIGAWVGRVAEDVQFQFHSCCCCQVHVFQALGFSILLPGKKMVTDDFHTSYW